MGIYVEMKVEVEGHRPEKTDAIVQAIQSEWHGFTDVDDKEGSSIIVWGEGSAGFNVEDNYPPAIKRAVWKANGEYCDVNVVIFWLENCPYDTFPSDEDEYAELMSAVSEQRL